MQVRLLAAVAGCLVFGWATVTAANLRHEAKPVVVETWVVVEPAVSELERARAVPTPYADSLLDMVEVERQADCLWEFLYAAQVEITLEVVLAAGTWTDALGGPCLVIGEDNE
jgi:hypothetical protein